MPTIAANLVYESSSDTTVDLLELSQEQFEEVIAHSDPEGWVTMGDLSFDPFEDCPSVPVPFTGTIELVITFYEDD